MTPGEALDYILENPEKFVKAIGKDITPKLFCTDKHKNVLYVDIGGRCKKDVKHYFTKVEEFEKSNYHGAWL